MEAEDELSDEEDSVLILNRDTVRLILRVCSKILDSPVDSSLRTRITNDLWPRHRSDLKSNVTSPRSWQCRDKELMKQMHKLLSRLGPSLGMRLPEIVRSNALGIVTNAEQIGHYSNYRHLSGVALYYEPSFFNHSCTPNCSRYHLGDWTIIRTNQEVKQGEELCISYIEHEFLFEPLAVRQTILDEQRKDFRLDIAIDDGELMDRCDVDKDAATSELGIRRVTISSKGSHLINWVNQMRQRRSGKDCWIEPNKNSRQMMRA